MATPPDSPIEEVVYELETTRVPKPIPVALEDLCRQTKFTRQEIRVMYRGFKTVICFHIGKIKQIYNAYRFRNVPKVSFTKTALRIFMQNFFHMEVSNI